jgi:serine carboxypeptidase 1
MCVSTIAVFLVNRWDGLKQFNGSPRKPIYCKGGEPGTQGFVRSYKNLRFYWILGAGHMVIYQKLCSNRHIK